MTKTFSKDYLTNTLNLPDNDELVISDKVRDNDRWTVQHELIFKDPADGKCYRTVYRAGATEVLQSHPWQYDNTVTAAEVKLLAVVKQEYVPVGMDITNSFEAARSQIIDQFVSYLESQMPHDICDGEEAMAVVRRAAAEVKDEPDTERAAEPAMPETQTESEAETGGGNDNQPLPPSSTAQPAPVSERRTFTGFFDSNGKQIHVGDKVKETCNGLIGTVGWDAEAGTYKLVEYGDYYITDADTDWEVLPDQEQVQTNAPDFLKFFEKFKKKMDDVFYLDTETTLLDLGDEPEKRDSFRIHCPDGTDLNYRLGDLYDNYACNKISGADKPLKSIIDSIETAYDTHDRETESEYDRD